MTIINTNSEKDLIDEIREIYIYFKKNKIKVYAQKKFKKEFSSYKKDEKIIKKAIDFKKNAINRKEQLLYVYQIATIIDACYSTQVRRFNNIYYICDCIYKKEKKFKDLTSQLNDEYLINTITELVNEILKDKKIEKKPFSFVTKYFALHRKRFDKKLKPLPIYDRYVQMYLDSFYYRDNKRKFYKEENNYSCFYDDMNNICSKLGIDFDKLDNKIWFTAKSLQFLIGKNESKNNLDKIINNDLKNIDDCDSCDYRYFIRILKDIKSNQKENIEN